MIRTVLSFLLVIAVFLPVSPGFAQTTELPDEAFVSGVPSHAQSYTLSCESRSASDWAAYFGVEVGETDFLNNLPRSDNPEKGFVGDPNGTWGSIPPYSYGVHAAPVAAGLRGAGVEAEARRDLTWDDLRSEIASGQPVIVWIIGQMWSGTPVSYQAEDGEVVTVAYYEHSMILTGYSPGAVYVIDAYSGFHQTYSLDSFLSSWGVLGNQAVIYAGDILPEAAEERLAGESYTVQPGDYLNGLALQFGLDWQDLARWNRLDSPYTIYAGQVLLVAAPDEYHEPASDDTPLVEPPSSKPGIHRVAIGDTLLGIAQLYKITWQELAATNGLLYPYFIYPQQELLLPDTAQAGKLAAAEQIAETGFALEDPLSDPNTAQPEQAGTYTVQPGDGLMAIAEEFGLDWLNLADLNGIEYPYVLYPGRILLLR